MREQSEQDLVLGIDLGTTFSACAKWERGHATIVQNSNGGYTTQSVVYRNPRNGEILTGDLAYRQMIVDPGNGVLGVKRMMDDGSHVIKLADTEFTPVDISAEILKRVMRDTLNRVPNSRAVCSVITVPYYFKAHQCENTRRAAEQAGIDCNAILQEPIAASIEYAWNLVRQYPEGKSENILLFDLGGGTFDLTLFALQSDRTDLNFQVLATDGDDRLGGMDFDEAMKALILSKVDPPVDLSQLSGAKLLARAAKLITEAREAKHRLSESQETAVMINDLTPGVHADVTVTRKEFEEAIAPYVNKIDRILEDILTKAGNTRIDRVVPVGGSSHVPAVRSLLVSRFAKGRIWADVEEDFAVAKGAAIYAAYLDDPSVIGRKINISTINCHALGVEVLGGGFKELIKANRQTPARVKHIFSRAADNQTNLDIQVYQGSSPVASKNTHVGTVSVTGMKPKPRGTSDVLVTFMVSKDQTLTVTVEVDGRSVDSLLAIQ